MLALQRTLPRSTRAARRRRPTPVSAPRRSSSRTRRPSRGPKAYWRNIPDGARRRRRPCSGASRVASGRVSTLTRKERQHDQHRRHDDGATHEPPQRVPAESRLLDERQHEHDAAERRGQHDDDAEVGIPSDDGQSLESRSRRPLRRQRGRPRRRGWSASSRSRSWTHRGVSGSRSRRRACPRPAPRPRYRHASGRLPSRSVKP